MAMQSFAFLCVLPLLIITACRLAGISLHYVSVNNINDMMYLELLLSALTTWWLLLAVCIWGGGCYEKWGNNSSLTNLVGTGFGFDIACFLFMIGVTAAFFLIWRNPDYQIGNEGTGAAATQPSDGFLANSSDSSSSTSYKNVGDSKESAEPETFSYQNTES